MDFMNKYGTSLGYVKDKPSFQLSDYIKENKKKFVELIQGRIGKDFAEYECSKGKVDLIIKTNLLHKHFKNGSEYTGDYYSCITIEYANVKINKKGELCNYPPRQKYYKYKNWLLKNECINNNIKVDYSFVVGRRYDSIQSYDTLFENDTDYTELHAEIQKHYKTLEEDKYIIGKNLFPNMKNKQDYPWHSAKLKIAKRIEEITCLKGIGPKKRDLLVEEGIVNYSSLVEQVKEPLVYDNCSITPEQNSLFVDFEVLSNVYDDFSKFPEANTEITLFNIGCGYEKRSKFHFKSYVAHKIEEEKSILEKFLEFVDSLDGDTVTIHHWTHVEKTIFNKKIEQYGLTPEKEIKWFDLHKFFNSNKITVKDCYTYKLKDVAKSLYANKVIKSKWDGALGDGLQAMVGYIKYATVQPKNKKIIKDIAHYNMIDCKVLWEIRNIFTSTK